MSYPFGDQGGSDAEDEAADTPPSHNDNLAKVIGGASLKEIAEALRSSEPEAASQVSDISHHIDDEIEPLKKGVELLTKRVGELMSEVKSAKELNKKGINYVGRYAKKNQKYLKTMYKNFHG